MCALNKRLLYRCDTHDSDPAGPGSPLASLRCVVAGLVGVGLSACGNAALDLPRGTTDACGYSVLEDINPDASIVEVNLEASPANWDPGNGIPIQGMGFNGLVPGPAIVANVGDTVIIHFKNSLAEETTIHWHGLRIPSGMDGTHIAQHPVPPGGSFDYQFIVPDAGFFWYHPHMNTTGQLENGLYAPFIVRDSAEPEVACDQTLVLDDVLLDSDGQLEPQATDSMAAMNGRLGNLLLVNGIGNRRLAVEAGTWQLWRLVNSANTRYFDLSVEGHRLMVIGTDGGYLPTSYTVDHLLLAPGERALVLVHATGEPGAEYAVKTELVPLHSSGSSGHSHGGMASEDPLGDQPKTLMWLDYSEKAAVTAPAPTVPVVSIPDWTAGEPVLHHWVLDESMMDTTIDGELWPNVPLLQFPLSGPSTFEIENKSTMHHPMHFHGLRFQVVARDGLAVVERAWKDTVDVPPESTLTLVMALDNPGSWLYHCHILEHEEAGMMGELEILAP